MTMLLLSKHTTGSMSLLLAIAQLALICLTGLATTAQAQFSSSSSISCFGGNAALSNKTYGEWQEAIVGSASPIYTRPEFEDFIDADATGELGAFGHCSRLVNGNLLGLAYICKNTGDEVESDADCLCLAEYNGTVCTSCTLSCNASAPAGLENFEADCSNVNGECKIECGQAVGSAPSDNAEDFGKALIDEATKEVCPYPASSSNVTDPSYSPPSDPPPTSSAMQQQPKSMFLALSVLLAATSIWIY
jgi:hypothetical protein